MIPHKNNLSQLKFFSSFEGLLNQKLPLYILANKVDWLIFDEASLPLYYPNNGSPAKPMRNISDESLIDQCTENIYYKYFCGDQNFVHRFPCEASEFVHFC